ncbi:hypothetical protein [Rhodococcus sp. NPDC003348]
MKRTATVIGALGLTLGLGAGFATAEPVTEPAEVSTGSTVIDTIERAATAEDAAGAIQTAAGEITVKALRECGLGALIGTATDEATVKNVGVFVSAVSKRILAITNGPAAVISVVAGGCVERSLLAFDVNSGSAKMGGSVASLALGGLLGTGSLAAASSDSGSADLGLEGWFDELLGAGSSDTASADSASSDTASADSASASGLLDSGSLEASAPVSDALLAGAAGA